MRVLRPALVALLIAASFGLVAPHASADSRFHGKLTDDNSCGTAPGTQYGMTTVTRSGTNVTIHVNASTPNPNDAYSIYLYTGNCKHRYTPHHKKGYQSDSSAMIDRRFQIANVSLGRVHFFVAVYDPNYPNVYIESKIFRLPP